MSYPFNIRVYGILIHERRVLVADEYFHDTFITKFPGGGLQYGEGTKEGLIRELKEELGLDVHSIRHFYTTDFFLPSAFDPSKQIISIYYYAKADDLSQLMVSDRKPEKNLLYNGYCSFRWLPIDCLSEMEFTFQADKKVAVMLRDEWTE
jgi:ADP-ribose pyrophosphatase YjhB (NUDIX family)